MSEVLFTATNENLETGLRGYPVGYCNSSFADPQLGLHYVGRPVSQMGSWRPEEVIYLLLNKTKGSKAEVAEFSRELAVMGTCSPELVASIEALPRKGHPMKLLSAALLLLGVDRLGMDEESDYRRDALNVIAKMPHLVATVINHHAGWGKTWTPDPELGYMENFTAMVNVPDKNDELLLKTFSLFNILHYDHGGGNLSAFVGKAVASGMEDMYGSLAASMCALAGPRHGKANQDCLEFVRDVLKEVGNHPKAGDVGKLIRQRLDSKQLVYGFGHAVLRVEDPRASLFYDFAEANFSDDPLVRIARALRTEGVFELKKEAKIANPYPNIDAISGTVLAASGFDYPEYFTVLFGLARAIGIAIQIIYERCEARGGKGTPIVRPRYIYSGPKP